MEQRARGLDDVDRVALVASLAPDIGRETRFWRLSIKVLTQKCANGFVHELHKLWHLHKAAAGSPDSLVPSQDASHREACEATSSTLV